MGIPMGVCMCAQVPVEAEEVRVPGNRVTSSCELQTHLLDANPRASERAASALHRGTSLPSLHVSLNAFLFLSTEFTVQDCAGPVVSLGFSSAVRKYTRHDLVSPTCSLYLSMLSVLDHWLSNKPPKNQNTRSKTKPAAGLHNGI